MTPPARSAYVMALDAGSGKSAVVLGLAELLSRRGGRLAFLRPVVSTDGPDGGDPDLDLVLGRYRLDADRGRSWVATAAELRSPGGHDELLKRILTAHRELARDSDVVLVEGSDLSGASRAVEFEFNVEVARQLGAPVVLVVGGLGRTAEQVLAAVGVGLGALADGGCVVLATVCNRVDPALAAQVRARLPEVTGDGLSAVLPDVPLLSAPTVDEVARALGAEPLLPGAEAHREVTRVIIGAMSLPHFLERVREGDLVITAGDRADIIAGSLAAQLSGTYPAVAGLLLTGGAGLVPDPVRRLVVGAGLPVLVVDGDTYPVATAVGSVRGAISAGSERKIAIALALVAEHLDADELLRRLRVHRAPVTTPMVFEHDLLERARADRRHVVLPEGDDDRVLRAAGQLLAGGVVDLTVLGDPAAVRSRVANPDAGQLADIAVSAAGTAALFGIEPRVAMLSYSTGESGAGADVEVVRRATALARERRPDLPIEGPIQYDAAVDPGVARRKLPGSAVAGRATVFVFPDLNTGNNTYKAVQRSAGAVAIGPVLQGLAKPVNDLSRGATVADIVNTVAITAIQAQGRVPG